MNSAYSAEYRRASNMIVAIDKSVYLSRESKDMLISKISKRESTMEDLDNIDILRKETIRDENKKICKHCGKEIVVDINVRNWIRIEFCTDKPCRARYFTAAKRDIKAQLDPNYKYVTECLVCGKTIPDERKANRAKTCSSECSDTHTKNLKRKYNKRMIDSGKNLLQKKSIALRHEINKSELNEDIKKELLHKITHATKPEEITKIRILKREYINKITIKTCALCGKEIPFDINIKGWHKLKYCIDESACTGTRPRSKSIRKPKEKTKHMCVICGNLIINNGTKYCSPLCKKEVKRRESEKARRDKGIVPRDIAAIMPKVNRVKIVRTEKENLELKLSKYRKLLEDAISISDVISYSKKIVLIEKKLEGLL